VIYNSLIDTYMSHDYFPWLAIAKRNIIPNKRQNLIKKIIFDSPKMLKDELISSFPNIKKLEFGLEYTHPLHPGSLPSSLQSLKFGFWCKYQLVPGDLPHTLTKLTL